MGRKSKDGDTYKVRCVGYNDAERLFTIGKVYEVKNNGITNDLGFTYHREYDTNTKIIDWLKRWYEFEVVNEQCIVIYSKGNEVIALNKETGKKGVAKCSPEDEFDFMVGAKLAFERLVGLPVKEVKRLANVGEYIKIVNATNDIANDYENGDILKVIRVEDDWAYYKEGCGKFAKTEEYVVLENYSPVAPAVPEKTLYNGKVVCVDNDGDDDSFTIGKVYTFTDGVCRDNDGSIRPSDYKIENIKEYNERSAYTFIELVE